jgi:hypothetical protein
MKKLLIALFVLISISGYAQTTWMNQPFNYDFKRGIFDSTLRVPVINSNRAFYNNKDSIGLLWFNSDSAKLFTRFPGNIIRSLPPVDSVIINRAFPPQSANYNITGSGKIGTYLDHAPQGSTPSYSEGRVWYDDGEKSLSIYDDITNTSLQVGQESYVRARNSTGSTIVNGSVVYINGSTGTNPTVALAKADLLSTARVIGMATHDIANNTVGKITVIGNVNDLNTSAFSAGDSIYLSATTAGAFTNIPPTFPNFPISLGYVIRSHVNMGRVLLNIQKAPALSAILNQNASAQSANYSINGNGSASSFHASNAFGATYKAYYNLGHYVVDTSKRIFSIGLMGSPSGPGGGSGDSLKIRAYDTSGVSQIDVMTITRGGAINAPGGITLGAVNNSLQRLLVNGSVKISGPMTVTGVLVNNGGLNQAKTTTVTGDYTVLATDLYINVNNSSNCTITLPLQGVGYVFYVKKISNNASTVTIQGANGTELIDDATTLVLSAYKSAVVLHEDFTQWWVY